MVAQQNLPPLPVNMISAFDLNRNVVQYSQQDMAIWFNAATQAPVTIATTGITTAAVFGLYNPIASTKVLIIRSIQLAVSGEPAAAANIFYVKKIGSGANPTGVTGLTASAVVTQVGINFGVTAVGVAFSAATLTATPVLIRVATNVLSTTAPQIAIDDQINGQLQLAPGDQFAVQADAACSFYASITWEERAWF